MNNIILDIIFSDSLLFTPNVIENVKTLSINNIDTNCKKNQLNTNKKGKYTKNINDRVKNKHINKNNFDIIIILI